VVEEEQPRGGAELLVEVVFELQRPPPLVGVGRVEGRLRIPVLERPDDAGGVADHLAVQL